MDLSKLRYQHDFHAVVATPYSQSPEWLVEILHESGGYARIDGKPVRQTVANITELEKLIEGLEKKWKKYNIRWNLETRRGSKIDWIDATKYKPDIADLFYLVYSKGKDTIDSAHYDKKWGFMVGGMPLDNPKLITHWAYPPDRPR